jgi:site-specific DNA-cytosine methylase
MFFSNPQQWFAFAFEEAQNQMPLILVLANEIEPDFAKSFALNHPHSKVICNDIHAIDFQQELQNLSISHIDTLPC